MRLAVVLVGATLGASAAAGPRPGKVVRIERHSHARLGNPRLCSVTGDPTSYTGYCVGAKPETGERVVVLDSSKPIAAVRVTSAQPYIDGCNNETGVWIIQAALESGDPSAAQGQAYGVIDVPVDARAGHLIAVDKSPSGHTLGVDQIEAVDSDGDGEPDVEFIGFPCDELGNLTTSSNLSCTEVWIADGRGFQRIRQAHLRTCF